MGPKKGNVILDENYWRISIEDDPLNEETWNVKVILIEAAGSEQDRIYLNKFEIFAAEERRFVIKNICKTETIFMVNQLGGEKKVKDDSLRVFEEGQSYLKDKKDIPSDILALIIKYLILKMKDEYIFIKRQKLEVREGMKRESATMINRAEVRGTVSVKAPDEPEPQILQVKEKDKKGNLETMPQIPELTEGKKYNTLLRVRGEEWRDKVYVDDFPTDGPNLYVAITGFVDPYLAGCLIKIGVPLTAVIQIRIDPSTVRVPSSLFRATKRGQSQTELLTAKSLKFWEDLQQLRTHRNFCDDYKNTAFIVFSPPYWDTESLSGNPEKIYDEVCFLLYDIQDLTRQHEHYIENMDVINIPEVPAQDCYQQCYYQQIDEIPLECTTIFSILDGMLQAVCISDHNKENSSKTSLSTAMTLNQPRQSNDTNKLQKAENLVQDVFNNLCVDSSKKKAFRATYGEEYESHKDPIVIKHGDFTKYKTFQLGNINIDNIVCSMLYGLPMFKLWQNQERKSGEVEAKVNFHVNVLLSCFERQDVETAELNRLLHILACRKLYNNRSSLKKQHLPPSTITEFKKVYLKRSVLAEPLPTCSSLYRSWSSMSPPFISIVKSNDELNNIDGSSDHCRIKFLFDCPDISELVSAVEIATDKPMCHLIEEFEFFEDYSSVSGLQSILHAFNKFNCIDYKYCEVTDCFILMFFNSCDKDGIARDEWRCHLPTPLCLQDFFDFVLEEHYDWIQKEEAIYIENAVLRSQSIYKDCFDPLAGKSCLDNAEINVDLLLDGSLKYQEFMNTEEVYAEATETKTKTTTISPSTTDMPSKSSKKTKSPISTPKNLRQSFVFSDSGSSINVPKKPFSSYNLSDRRVEVFGKDSCFFSKDGTQISTRYTIMIPGNVEHIILKVVPGNDNFEFWMHKSLGEYLEPHIADTCESFRISNKEGIIIYIKKQTYLAPLPAIELSYIERPKEKYVKSPSPKLSSSKLQIMEQRSFHSLYVTWPNGLVTETIHENNSAEISHIKQHYIVPLQHLDEDMRCVSLSGDVIIFKNSGLIEVLRPNGSYIKITNCEKRLKQELLEDFYSDTSSDKKGKGKDKNKPSKVSSKSSKNVIDKEEKLSDTKQPEYELFIDEFEIIEADGVRQKWNKENLLYAQKLLIRTGTDFCLGEVFSRRMDGTNTLLNKDGIYLVTFPDGTRIITTYIVEETEIYPEWTQEEIDYFAMLDSDVAAETYTMKSKSSLSQKSFEGTYRHSNSVASTLSKTFEEGHEEEEIKKKVRTDGFISVQIMFTIEHKNFATVKLNSSNGAVSIKSPWNIYVTVTPTNYYNFTLDNFTSAEFNGQDLNICYKACLECESVTSCKIRIKYDEINSASKFHKSWLHMDDSYGKKITVNNEGNIIMLDESPSPKGTHTEDENNADKMDKKCRKEKSESSFTSIGKCREVYQAQTMRFFILRRELTCSELVHRALVDQFKQNCRWQPWCSVNQYDTFGDNRSILSILTPVHLTESEKWLMESELAEKPKYLTYKDLKKDCGKGFYHWMRPYDRFQPKPLKPQNVVPDRLPRAYILRNLEQEWGEAKRDKLKGGRELLSAILRYRHILESNSDTILYVPIREARAENERRVDDIIQAVAHRTYEDLKARLAQDVQTRAKPSITTGTLPPSEDISVEGELEESEMPDELAALEERERRTSAARQLESAEGTSPALQRYWRRRAEELSEEQFYKYLLREGSVPPYFRNVLGGAIWWEMNNVAKEAAIRAERRKMKCICHEEGEHSSNYEHSVPLPQ